VEPVAGVLGALLVTYMDPVLPYALGFAAGAMVYVVIDDIVPEAQTWQVCLKDRGFKSPSVTVLCTLRWWCFCFLEFDTITNLEKDVSEDSFPTLNKSRHLLYG
jgi:zinc transporter ZupT